MIEPTETNMRPVRPTSRRSARSVGRAPTLRPVTCAAVMRLERTTPNLGFARMRLDKRGTRVPPYGRMAEAGTQAIDRAAELLVSVVESPRPLGVSELSQSAGLPKSTTSRLVGALERRGLVQRARDRRVAPGPVLLRFAHRDAGESLVELARPALKSLADLSGETINLGVPTPLGVEHLD